MADPIDSVTGLTTTANVAKADTVSYLKSDIHWFSAASVVRTYDLSGRNMIAVGSRVFKKDVADISADDGTESGPIIIDAGGTHWVLLGWSAIDTDTALTANSDVKVASQKAVKTYVDGLAINLGKRARVRVATTANVTISTALNNGDTLDGVTLVTGDYVLVKDQSSALQNGVYVVGVSPVRATEFDTYDEHPGSLIVVEEGSTLADTLWICTSNIGGTLNTTAIAFTRVRIDIAIPVTVAQGGTNATDAATARTNLGVAYGKQTIWVPASSMEPLDSFAPVPLKTVSPTYLALVNGLTFSETVAQYAEFQIYMPKSWDGGAISAVFVWDHGATVTNFGVVWTFAAMCRGDNEAIDNPFGTAILTTDTGGATRTQYISPETAAITVGSSPAGEKVVYFAVGRAPTETADTLAVVARLIGVRILYTTNANNDT